MKNFSGMKDIARVCVIFYLLLRAGAFTLNIGVTGLKLQHLFVIALPTLSSQEIKEQNV